MTQQTINSVLATILLAIALVLLEPIGGGVSAQGRPTPSPDLDDVLELAQNFSGSNPIRVTNNIASDTFPAWRPPVQQAEPTATPLVANSSTVLTNGVIAYVSSKEGDYQIYTIDPASGAETRLTNIPGYKSYLSWSLDGSQLTFLCDGIFAMNADGSNQRDLTLHGAVDMNFAWSPDGRQIAYVSQYNLHWGIYGMNADGTRQRLLTEEGVHEYTHIYWSPDGTYLMLDLLINENHEVYRMNADGSHLRDLSLNNAADWGVGWSPDGRQFLFASKRDGNWDLYVMNADGSDQRNLTNSEADNMYPQWSPDGRQIAFASNRDGHASLYLMNADGGDLHRLIEQYGPPIWSPDGQQIAFTITGTNGNPGQLYVVNADGSDPRLLEDQVVFVPVAWQPIVSPLGN